MKNLRDVLLFAFSCPLLVFAATSRPVATPGAVPQYLFYLHGAIVEGSNGRPVSPEHGVYQYPEIVAALAGHGFEVRSEVRPANTNPQKYAEGVAREIRELLASGVPEDHIAVVGASKGGVIAAFVSSKLDNPGISYVFLAGLFADAKAEQSLVLHGRVFSIHDAADKNLISSDRYFRQSPDLTERKALVTKTGLGHGLIFTPNPAWLAPAMDWLHAGQP